MGLSVFKCSLVCFQLEPFMERPSRTEWPEYYERITTPICISDIYYKTQTYKYGTVDDAMKDWELLSRNAEEVCLWVHGRVDGRVAE